MTRNITIYDIAKEAGVSTATVSRVLAGTGPVSAKTEKKVLAVMEAHQYHPSAIARGLYTNKSKMLCMILPELNNPYYQQVFSSALIAAGSHDHMLSALYHPYNHSITEQMAQRLIEQRVDGVILNGEFLNPEDAQQMALLHQMQRYMGIMLIGCMPPIADIPTITINLANCARQAVEYLYQLGHRRIWLVGGGHSRVNPYSREVGFRDAMQQRGLWHVNAFKLGGMNPLEDGSMALSNCQRSEMPTAIVCANDLVALGVIKAAKLRGLSVPGDLSVIGCDNTYLTAYAPTEITTFDISADEVGRMAVERLLEAQTSDNIEFQGELILRESCAGIK